MTLCIVGTLLLLISATVGGCGVPKDLYAAAVSEKDVAKSQLQSASTELDKAKAQLELTKSQLQTANGELDRTKADLQSVNSQLQSTKSSLSDVSTRVGQLQQTMTKARVLADVSAAVFVPALKGQNMTQAQETALGLTFVSKVAASGDPRLQGLFQAWVDSNFADNRMVDLFVYIFEALPKLLQ